MEVEIDRFEAARDNVIKKYKLAGRPEGKLKDKLAVAVDAICTLTIGGLGARICSWRLRSTPMGAAARRRACYHGAQHDAWGLEAVRSQALRICPHRSCTAAGLVPPLQRPLLTGVPLIASRAASGERRAQGRRGCAPAGCAGRRRRGQGDLSRGGRCGRVCCGCGAAVASTCLCMKAHCRRRLRRLTCMAMAVHGQGSAARPARAASVWQQAPDVFAAHARVPCDMHGGRTNVGASHVHDLHPSQLQVCPLLGHHDIIVA
jgi:hypothetical protein